MPVVVQDIDVTVPDGITDLEAFRRWAYSDDFPEGGRVHFINGKVWVDTTMEQIYSHNQVKTQFAAVLTMLVEKENLGRYFGDGAFLTNVEVGLGNEPDGMFVSYETFDKQLMRQIPSGDNGCLELAGRPDMVLEVVSKNSVHKDTVELPEVYFRAGIPECWLVDARKDPIKFDVLRHDGREYIAAQEESDGWLKSNVFGRSFRLTRTTDRSGNPKFTLEVR